MASATQAWRSAPDSPAGAVQTRMSLGGGVLLSPYDPATEEALAIAARVSGTYRNARRVPAKQPVPAAAEGPRWVDRLVAEAVQFDLIRTHGGVPGLRDEHALEAALARALQRHACEPPADLAGLAAAYGHGLATDHRSSTTTSASPS